VRNGVGVRISTPARESSTGIKPQPPAAPTAARDSTQRIGSIRTPIVQASQPIPNPTPTATPSTEIPQLSEEAELEAATDLLRKRQWTEARKALQSLAARDTVNKRYRALLSYARGREAQDEARHDEARAEFTRALQLDPDLSVARSALAQVAEEPKKPQGGLFSRLLKK
jgi:hypothetical protein